MNKHKHYNKIIAFASDTSLVLFVNDNDEHGWYEVAVGLGFPPFYEGSEYFLCLPQHNKSGQCLHWLNEGEVIRHNPSYHGKLMVCEKWDRTWSKDHPFMNEFNHFSIMKEEEKPTPLNIPWDSIDKHWNYAAMDENGLICLYNGDISIVGNEKTWKPKIESDGIEIGGLLTIPTKDINWKLSLTKRPEVALTPSPSTPVYEIKVVDYAGVEQTVYFEEPSPFSTGYQIK